MQSGHKREKVVEGTRNFFKEVLGAKHNLFARFFVDTDTRLRSMGAPGSPLRRKAEKIANKLFTPTGVKEIPGYVNVVTNNRALWTGLYHVAYKGLNKEQRETLGQHIILGTEPTDPVLKAKYKEYRKVSDKFYSSYVSNIYGAGAYDENHFHRVWSADKIESNRAGLEQLIRKAAESKIPELMQSLKSALTDSEKNRIEEQIQDLQTLVDEPIRAERLVESMVRSLYGLEDAEFDHTEPTKGGAIKRKLWFIDNDFSTNTTVDGSALSVNTGAKKVTVIDFIETDTAIVADNYVQQIVKRYETETRFGELEETGDFTVDKDGNEIPLLRMNPVAKLDKFSAELVNKEDKKFFDALVRAHFGQLGNDMDPKLKGAQALFLAAVNWAILFLATLGSLPELAGSLIRLKDHKDSYKLFVKSLNKKGMMNRARAWGYTDERMERQTGFAFYSSRSGDKLGQLADKMNDTLFKVNLLQQWTTYTRAVASAAGEDALVIAANDFKNDNTSKNFIEELVGEKNAPRVAEAIVRWDKAGRKLPDVNTATFHGSKDIGSLKMDRYASDEVVMQQVLGRFVDESIVRPNAGTQPLWMSDPRYALLSHLKPYFFAMQKQILPTLVDSFSKTDMKNLRHATPMIAFGLAALPLAMIGMETRDWMKINLAGKDSFTDKLDTSDYILEAFFRSNGIMALEPLRGALDAQSFGETMIEGFTPSIGVGFNMLDQITSLDPIGNATPVIGSF